ncbi:MAG: pyrroline-5-carboxylate reductase, partial [Rhodospirillaceae bacterium]
MLLIGRILPFVHQVRETPVMNGTASVLLVGCGRMGGALLKGWQARGVAIEQLWVVEPDAAMRAGMQEGVHKVATAADLPANLRPEAVVFAVKPQNMAPTVAGYR